MCHLLGAVGLMDTCLRVGCGWKGVLSYTSMDRPKKVIESVAWELGAHTLEASLVPVASENSLLFASPFSSIKWGGRL